MKSHKEIFHPNKKLKARKLKHIETYFSGTPDTIFFHSPTRYKISLTINKVIDEIRIYNVVPSKAEPFFYPAFKFPLPYLVHIAPNSGLVIAKYIKE